MNGFTLIDTFGNGMKVWRAENAKPVAVQHGTILIKGHSTYKVGTCNGFNAEGYGKGFGTVFGDEICREGIDEMVWINARPATICAGEHPDNGLHALEVEIGDQVWLEGKKYEIASAANQNLKLIEV